MTEAKRWLVLGSAVWFVIVMSCLFVDWHERKKQQAFESVLAHGYHCTPKGCEPLAHWSVSPEKEGEKP